MNKSFGTSLRSSEDASLFEAATLMYKNKIGALMINEAGSEERLSANHL